MTAKKPSLRKSINAMCRSCIFDSKSGLGTWRAQVAQCTAVDCPLWAIRPGPESGPHIRELEDGRVYEWRKRRIQNG